MTYIRPVELSGMVQRTNDISTMKHQEDAKPMVDQSNIQHTVHKHTEHIMQEVADKDNADREQTGYDAKEKGRNTYSRPQGKREKQHRQPEDKVVRKEQHGFDIKI